MTAKNSEIGVYSEEDMARDLNARREAYDAYDSLREPPTRVIRLLAKTKSKWTKDCDIPLGATITAAIRSGKNRCDICGRKYHADILGPEEDKYGWYIICNPCIGDRRRTDGEDPGATATFAGTFSGSGSGTDNSGVSHNSTIYGGVKCPNGHYFLFTWPKSKGYGSLRLTSSQGWNGGQLDLETDLALFFDKWGWDFTVMSAVEIYPGSNNRNIPDLGITDDAPPIAIIKWPDFTAPTATVKAYVKYAAECIAEGKRVQVGCLGGHGRTGTFAAMVMIALGATHEKALRTVRTEYCLAAVESKTQEMALPAFEDELRPDSVDWVEETK